MLKRLKSFFKANPGAAFIFAFQILLITGAVLLSAGDGKTAERIALYAFYALVVATAIQIGVTIRERRSNHRTGTDTNSNCS